MERPDLAEPGGAGELGVWADAGLVLCGQTDHRHRAEIPGQDVTDNVLKSATTMCLCFCCLGKKYISKVIYYFDQALMKCIYFLEFFLVVLTPTDL